MSFTRREILVASAALAASGIARSASSSRVVDVVAATHATVDRIDRAGPTLRSFCELNPDAHAIAEKLDASTKKDGALFGVPIAIKDNIDTADAMSTCAGSLALVGVKRAADAPCVAKLRAAGAVLIGKTNCSEWANFRSTRSVSGWSGRGGQTRNPHVLDRNPSGSSSGSAAAVAAGIVPVALGSETDGSITSPAAACGVVGFKPSLGVVSSKGVIPISSAQDCVGPIARSVADCALVFAVIRERGERNAHQLLDGATLKGKRVGVVRSFAGFHRDVDALFDDAIKAMKNAGATVVEQKVEWPGGAVGDAENTALVAECRRDLDSYLGGLTSTSPVHSIADLIAWNRAHANDELLLFGQELLEQAAAKTVDDLKSAIDARKKANELANTALASSLKDVDVCVMPTQGPAWLTDIVDGDFFVGGATTSLAAIAGAPHCSVPMGFVHALPIGLSIIGRVDADDDVLRFAHAFERATSAIRAPRFLATAPG